MQFTARAAKVTLGSASTTVSLIQVLAGTNHKMTLREVGVMFNGISATGNHVQVDLLRQSTAGTASALTLVKDVEEDGTTIDASAQETFTVEPTAGDVLRSWYVHPQGHLILPIEGVTVASGGRLAIRAITPGTHTSIDCFPWLTFTE